MSFGNGNITFLFCHVASRDYMIRGTRELVNGSPSSQGTILLSFAFAGPVEKVIKCFQFVTYHHVIP